MTREEASFILANIDRRVCDDELNDALDMAIKALEQEPCETIKEIPKDYKYDTETEDFLVYRHMYTGHEIHIEKPVPRYRLEQEPKTEWIPVSERLPNRNEFIASNGLFIVSDGNRSYAEYFDMYNSQKYFGEPTMEGFKIDRCVTKWMPLPPCCHEPQESEG